MNWLAVKRELATAVEAVDLLRGRSYHYSVRRIVPPGFYVALAEVMNFHGAYDDGLSRWRVPFVVVVGAADAESSEALLSEFTDEQGPRSVKRAVEDAAYAACDVVVVLSAEPEDVTIGDVNYLSARFTTEVVGGGR